MPDERLQQIRDHLKVAHHRGMLAARLCDEIHQTSARTEIMAGLAALARADKCNEETDAKLRSMEAAYDADAVDGDARDRRRRRQRGPR